MLERLGRSHEVWLLVVATGNVDVNKLVQKLSTCVREALERVSFGQV